MKYNISVFLVMMVFETAGFSQQTASDSLRYISERNIDNLFVTMAKTRGDAQKQEINQQIDDSLYALISKPGSFDFDYDSLKKMGKIFLDEVKIFTWNLPESDGSHKYFGYLLYEVEKDSAQLFKLTDKSLAMKNPEFTKCTHKNWFGALYYDIAKVKIQKQDYYVLMGFDPNNLFTNKKIIDVLYFDDLGNPVFGYPFFEGEKGMKYRVVFEYAKRAAMSLRYNKDLKMIVFDHLAPFEERYKGSPQFYGPDFSYDAYDFQKNSWKLVQDVDVRN